jgi:hypothetical protein
MREARRDAGSVFVSASCYIVICIDNDVIGKSAQRALPKKFRDRPL